MSHFLTVGNTSVNPSTSYPDDDDAADAPDLTDTWVYTYYSPSHMAHGLGYVAVSAGVFPQEIAAKLKESLTYPDAEITILRVSAIGAAFSLKPPDTLVEQLNTCAEPDVVLYFDGTTRVSGLVTQLTTGE